MRVLLARPPRRDARDAGLSVPPLGLAYIAAALRESGHQVDILDAYALGWGWRRFADAIAQRRPDVLGLSAMTPVADVAARAARIARPYARWIVLGGPHPTATEHAVLDEMPQIDAAVCGEGERITPLLLDWLEGGAEGSPPSGVIARGHPLIEATPEADLTTLAEPARDLLPMHAYRYLFATRPGFGTMITSRGCPFRCSFCDKSVGGSQWRARPPAHVVDEMERLVHHHGVKFINFYDDNFTLRSSRVVGICEEIIRRGLRVEWKCEGRVDAVNLELLTLMRRAGCRTVAYGVESGNAETLRLLRKDVSVDDAPAAFAATRAAGIRSLAYIILGAPGEDREDVRRTIRFCHEIGADYVQFSTLTAFQGTPLFQAGHVGADVRSPVDGDLHRATLTDLPPAELQALMREAWTGFYLRPRPMARLLRDAVASGAITEAWRLGAAWGRWAVPA
jgi:anaerobic magnesium-protoporphyrin IX monomethyl ester cyclase